MGERKPPPFVGSRLEVINFNLQRVKRKFCQDALRKGGGVYDESSFVLKTEAKIL